jgi:hypothetical protein
LDELEDNGACQTQRRSGFSGHGSF